MNPSEKKNRTPGHDLEIFLNAHHGPGTPYFDSFSALIKAGLQEGWVGGVELDGRKYRRGKILLPCKESRYFSITAVYLESWEEYSGQYHAHPYGEINCVIQLDGSA